MRSKLIVGLVCLCLVAAVVAGLTFMPKRYAVGHRLNETIIFWNDQEAFFFLNTSTVGHSSSFLSDKLRQTRYVYLGFLLEGRSQFSEVSTSAYRLLPSGELQKLPLPADVSTAGNWTLQDGKLRVTPVASPYVHHMGFAWDGTKFVPMAPERRTEADAATKNQLTPDDADDEDGEESGFLSRSARKTFKDAGWHYKELSGFAASETPATLTINLQDAAFQLTIESFPARRNENATFDVLGFGTRSLKLSAGDASGKEQTLWNQNGWQPITKGEFEARATRSGRAVRTPVAVWVWLGIFLLAALWRISSFGQLVLSLLGLKGKVLNNMATSFSFPPAAPSQFPALDTAALERYSREFEGLGFVKLLDFSLVSNVVNPIPSFCRLYVHKGNHCFAEVSQIFPRGKTPLTLACAIQSVLQNGWSLTFSDRKPLAASSMIRRPKALSVSMPGTPTSALLQNFLQMRERVCQDLGISPMKEDTLEAYIARVQTSATEMRNAVKNRNFAAGVSQVYFRKLQLLGTQEEYTWLGDYPQEAERRKQGYVREPELVLPRR